MAAEGGKIPKEYSGSVNLIFENGFVIPYTGGMKINIDKRRDRLGLPEVIGPKLEEIQFIFEETGLKALLDKNKEGEE